MLYVHHTRPITRLPLLDTVLSIYHWILRCLSIYPRVTRTDRDSRQATTERAYVLGCVKSQASTVTLTTLLPALVLHHHHQRCRGLVGALVLQLFRQQIRPPPTLLPWNTGSFLASEMLTLFCKYH